MKLDALRTNTNISAYRYAADSYLRASENARKIGLKDEQTVKGNESRYELDGTLKEEYSTIGKTGMNTEKESSDSLLPRFTIENTTENGTDLIRTALSASAKPAVTGGIRTNQTTPVFPSRLPPRWTLLRLSPVCGVTKWSMSAVSVLKPPTRESMLFPRRCRLKLISARNAVKSTLRAVLQEPLQERICVISTVCLCLDLTRNKRTRT